MPFYGGATDTTNIITQQLIVPGDHLLAAWTFDPANLQAGVLALGGGTLQVARMKLVNLPQAVNPGQITNIIFYLTAGGVTLTSGRNFAALYTDDGQALLGQTADQSSNWASGGLKTMAISGGPVNVANLQWIKVAWFNNGLTAPSLARGSNTAAASLNAGLSGTTLRWSTANTGLTTAPPTTIGTQTADSVAWWAGVN